MAKVAEVALDGFDVGRFRNHVDPRRVKDFSVDAELGTLFDATEPNDSLDNTVVLVNYHATLDLVIGVRGDVEINHALVAEFADVEVRRDRAEFGGGHSVSPSMWYIAPRHHKDCGTMYNNRGRP